MKDEEAVSEPVIVAQSNHACPEESLTEEDAEDWALAHAALERFEDPVVVEADLVTYDELVELHDFSPSHSAPCYWYAKMSGHLAIHPRWQSSTPPAPTRTPGASNTFIEMEVVMDSVTGYLTTSDLSTAALGTPITPTPGAAAASPTMEPPPTRGTIPATPTSAS